MNQDDDPLRFPLPPSFTRISPSYPAFNRPFLSDLVIFPIPFPLLQEILHGMIQELPRSLPFLADEVILFVLVLLAAIISL
jgi:hypothetical protein